MAKQVFLSYASGDLAVAQRVYDVLRSKNVSCWFAPVDVGPGAKFGEQIKTDIPQCRVFLLLWSQHAQASEYVQNEIAIAAKAKPNLLLFPVQLDSTEREGFYLVRQNWARMSVLGPEGIADEVGRHLRVADAPYPLGRLYRQIQGQLDFPCHLEAIRLLIRFVTLLQIAGYVRLQQRSEDLNRQIERVLPLDSLFADFEVGRAVKNWLEDRGAAVHEAFADFFRLPSGSLPGVDRFERDDYAADEFDRRHLHTLCDCRDDLSDGSTVPPEKADEQLCHAVRDFIRRALSQQWSTECRISLTGLGGGRDDRTALESPLTLTQGQAAAARLFVSAQGGSLDLSPFFTLLPGKGNAWELGMLRRQDERARYTPITTEGYATTERPAIVFPWGRLEVVRALPDVVYVGEIHTATLQLTNHAASEVQIPRIEETLPENLRSLDGARTVVVAEGMVLAANDTKVLEYQIRGASLPGAKRSFPAAVIKYLFQNYHPDQAEVWLQSPKNCTEAGAHCKCGTSRLT